VDELFKQLVIPLLGGFLFILLNYRTRYLFLPASGERFFLACGFLGAFGLVVGYVISHVLKVLLLHCPVSWVSHLPAQWHEWFPFSPPQLMALLGLPLVGRLLNRLWKRDFSYRHAIEASGDTLELFFDEAVIDRQLVQLSLKSGRVYVGFIEETAKPLSARRHIRLIPFMSGFRWPLDTVGDGMTKMPNRITWSTLYIPLVKTILKIGTNTNLDKKCKTVSIPDRDGNPVEIDAKQIGLVISTDDIETATQFDQKVYEYLNRDRYPYGKEKTKTKDAGAEPVEVSAG
jgi:hypothetical protein